MKQRRLQNGDLYFMYGFPSEPIKGYVQDGRNLAHFRQIMPDCVLRTEEKCGTCPNPLIKKVCSIGRPLDCVECNERSTDEKDRPSTDD